MKLTTTINSLFRSDFCKDILKKLFNSIGCDYNSETTINFLTILDNCGVEDFFLSFCSLDEEWVEVQPILTKITADIAESVLYIFEEKYPNDYRPRKAIEAARYETDEEKLSILAREAEIAAEMSSKAAKSAAYSAKYAALSAYSSTRAAKMGGGIHRASGTYAACTAEEAQKAEAYAATRKPKSKLKAEREKQIAIIKKYLTWD